MALSTPRPAKVAIRCSTVETLAPSALATTVASIVALTVSTLAGMRLAPSGRSVRTKITPAPAGAGRSVMRTGAPL